MYLRNFAKAGGLIRWLFDPIDKLPMQPYYVVIMHFQAEQREVQEVSFMSPGRVQIEATKKALEPSEQISPRTLSE